MKTLVIHPKDVTTDMLSEIYSDTNWTIINTDISKEYLKEQINAHDRIIMLGHGTPHGLLGFNRFIIDPSFVPLLKEKQYLVCIWCNADLFVKKYFKNYKGFYTGMIISEYGEALLYNIQTDPNELSESNSLFASSVKNSIFSNNMLNEMIENYKSDTNKIIMFNNKNLYHS